MLPGGTLDFELGATSDRLIVNGIASLAGNLNASLLGGFTPTAGNSFNILDWTSLAARSAYSIWPCSRMDSFGIRRISTRPAS